MEPDRTHSLKIETLETRDILTWDDLASPDEPPEDGTFTVWKHLPRSFPGLPPVGGA